MADFEREIEAANERMQAAIKRGPVAVSANYDRRLKLVLVALDTGLSIAFRPAMSRASKTPPQPIWP